MADLAGSRNILLKNNMEIFSQICRYVAAAIMDPARLLSEVSTWHALSSKTGRKDWVSQKFEFLHSHPLYSHLYSCILILNSHRMQLVFLVASLVTTTKSILIV